jgi:peroxiredoxin
MPAVPSAMLTLGTPAPPFRLPDTEGRVVARDDFAGRPLLVMFLSNHCPYVKHLRAGLAALGEDYAGRDVGIVAVMPNDVERYPADAPVEMRRERDAAGWRFPYLYDASQEVARAYRAACTPDLFLFDARHRLAYRGQFDASRPGNDVPVSGDDIRRALDAVLAGRAPAAEQRPSLGCSIKWKPGNAPDPAT